MQNFNKFWNQKWKKVSKTDEIGPTNFASKVLEFKNKGTLLDIGAGAGRDAMYFAELGFEVSALDFSEAGLQLIRNTEITKIIADITSYDFGENRYDIIYACNSLHYFTLKEFTSILEKLHSALKQDGYIFIRVKSDKDPRYGMGELVEESYYKNGEDYKYYFSKKLLMSICEKYTLVSLEEEEDIHNQICGEVTKNAFVDVVTKD